MVSGRADGERQGALMGLFTGLASLVSIVAPFTISLFHFAARSGFPGMVWILAPLMHVVRWPFVLAALKDKPVPVAA